MGNARNKEHKAMKGKAKKEYPYSAGSFVKEKDGSGKGRNCDQGLRERQAKTR